MSQSKKKGGDIDFGNRKPPVLNVYDTSVDYITMLSRIRLVTTRLKPKGKG